MFAFLPVAIISLQLFIIGPLFIVAANNDRSPIGPSELFQWPLVNAIIFIGVFGLALWTVRRAWGGRVVSIAWALALYLLIQFFWVIPDLGVLDGRQINFAAHWQVAIAEIFLAVGLLFFSLTRPVPAITYLSRITVIAFILTSGQTAISSLQVDTGRNEVRAAASPDFFRDAEVHDVLSLGEENAIVVVLDTLQGDAFEEVIKGDPSLRERFAGFTFYDNVTGHFPYTGLSVPAILSGAAYHGGDQSIPAYTHAAGAKRLEVVFEDRGLRWGRIPLESRTSFLDAGASGCRAVASVYDASVFRQLPLLTKPFFYAQGEMQFEKRCGMMVPANPSLLDLAVLERLAAETQVDGGSSKMVYVHLWGVHPPANLSEDCALAPPSADLDRYLDQAHCILARAADYVDRLRTIGAFEKSAVFILADHGSKYGFLGENADSHIPGFVRSSANPTILFHAPDQDGPLHFSSAPLALTDIYPTIAEAFGIEAESEGISISAIEENERRERSFLFYKGITDIYGDYIPQFERFAVNGHVRNAEDWKSLGVETTVREPLDLVDFGTLEASKYLNFGWSEEARGVSASWLVANPATITGLLPSAGEVRVRMKLMNPHLNQRLVFKIDGHTIGEVEEPVPTAWVEREFTFDTGALGQKLISFVIEAAQIRPQSINDTREVGVAFEWIKFEAIK